MSSEMVTQEQMAQALNKMGMGILMMLGITPTAEMGQAPWLDISANEGAEPLVNLDQIAGLVHDISHNHEQILASMGQASHPYGLCDSAECPPCRDQRRTFASKLAPQVEKATLAQVGTEMDAACKWAGLTGHLEQVMGAVSNFRDAGSPDLVEPEFNIIFDEVPA